LAEERQPSKLAIWAGLVNQDKAVTSIIDHMGSQESLDLDQVYWERRSDYPGLSAVISDTEDAAVTRATMGFLASNVEFQGRRVLDIGCGIGRLFQVFMDARAKSVHGLDICYKMLKIAAFRFPNEQATNGVEVVLLHACASQIGILFGSDNVGKQVQKFDVIVSVNALSCVTDDKKCQAALNGIASVIEPGGCVVLIEPMSICKMVLFEEIRTIVRPVLYYERALTTLGLEKTFDQHLVLGPNTVPDSHRHVLAFWKR